MRERSLVGAISFVLLSTLAHAQSSTPDVPTEPQSPQSKIEETPAPKSTPEKSKKETIQVTGSRIKQIDVETASPVTVFSKEDIDRSGSATVTDFIKNRIVSGSVTTENATLQQSAGTASFGGRDFDPEYTLVLVNGRRIPTNAIADDYVDLNLIPLAAIERIEYLTDGASAIYGSDAVAGVLNIITKKQFTGTQVVTRGGLNTKHKDGAETGLQIVSGTSSDKSNFLIAADLFKREPIKAINRPLINSSISPDGQDGRSPTGFPGYMRVTPAGGTPTTRPFADCPADQVASSGQCMMDVAPLYQVNPKTERQSIYSIFDHQLSDRVKFFGEARFARTLTTVKNGASPGQISMTGADYNALPDAFKAQSPFAGEAIADDARVQIGRRFVEFGPRVTDNTNESFNLVSGLSGTIGDETNWELTLAKHRLKNLQVGIDGNLDGQKVIGYFKDGTFNPFQLNTFNTAAQVAAKDDTVTEIFRLGLSDLEDYTLNFDGHLPTELPGGKIGWAAGIELRKERYNDQSDSLSQSGEIIGSAGGKGGGGQETRAGYVEAELPLLKSVNLSLALRHDSVQNTMGDKDEKSATTYHAGIQYAPIEMLKFRGTYSTGFKAAPLHDRFLQADFGVEQVNDPVGCANGTASCTLHEVNAQTTGNPNLDPEKSVYVNGGIVFQPLQDLNFTLDYWDLKIKDKIGQLSTQYILNNAAKYANLIHRSPAGTLDEDGSYVDSQLLNLNKNESAGIELGGSYQQNLGFARLNTGLKIAKTVISKTQETPSDPMCDLAKYTSAPNGQLNADLLAKSWSFSANAHYNSAFTSHGAGFTPGTCEFDATNGDTTFRVKHYADLDINVGYVAPWGTEFGIGVNNLTNAAPAYDQNVGWPWYDQGRYSNTGRFFYGTIGHKFD